MQLSGLFLQLHGFINYIRLTTWRVAPLKSKALQKVLAPP